MSSEIPGLEEQASRLKACARHMSLGRKVQVSNPESGRGRWEIVTVTSLPASQVRDWACVKHPPRTPVDLVLF